MESLFRVSNPPPRPLLIWDGECHFCRRWMERWHEITTGDVDYTTYQEAASRFPEIPREQFERSIVYIDRSGAVFTGAEAVYRSLGTRPSRKWLSWSYERLPGFAAISELAYRVIARHRRAASVITRFLWGNDVRPPTYFWAREWFLRALGLIFLIAFVSLWVQIDGLVGSNGLLPVSRFLTAVRGQFGTQAFSMLPTLCWVNSGDAFLHFLCGAGVVAAMLLICGIARVFCLVALVVFYLSLTVAGQAFLSFQWDVLLLETGFLAIFLAPPRLWQKREHGAPVSRLGLFLLKLLLFKLMLMSGVVKLTSGDDSWWNLTALDYHYWSQPLPTIFAWYADKTPEWFKHFSVAFCLVVEIVVPFFIWAPRRLRLIACGLLVFLQIAIAITGDYCFFNLLTIALCLLLIDDAVVAEVGVARRAGDKRANAALRRAKRLQDRLLTYGATVVIVITVPLNAWHIFSAFEPAAEPPAIVQQALDRIEPFHIVNGYGLFRVMTKDRGEIVIEGSADGIDWRAYEFKWKPGNVMRAPAWCAPHQPRLDWQMWFAALGSPRQNPWLINLVFRLFQDKPEVIHLLKVNPFPDSPPHYIRAEFYRYRFTTMEEHRKTGAWWKRQFLGEYLPEIPIEILREGRQ
jgi:predicted DCC family thiol-disulfide oxidoreductase YuxK